ncbi:hypothetical protein [Granulicoccus sp. GXG6511]|uniref:hypothetical protein n=1 Tax=Granulicoccus sp. GXG6511 TaxID=3381351 RepID=UPI003D7DF63A
MTPDRDDRLDDLLRTLDPAPDDLGTDARGRADALLEHITATPSPAQPGTPGGPPSDEQRRPTRSLSSGRPRARWVAIGAAAAAFAVAAATLPSLWPVTPAYATWTAEPIPVTGATRDKAVDACQKVLAERATGSRGGGPQPQPRAETARTVLAEQRGEVILVSLVTDNDSTYSCMFDADRPTRPVAGGGGIATTETPPRPPLGPDELRSFGNGLKGGADGGYADTSGRVGADVRSVTIHANGLTLDATVTDGVFAAWWPVQGPFEEPMITDIRFDVTLVDGSVRTGVDDGMDRGPRPGPREIGRVERGGGVGSDGGIGTAGGLVGSDVIGVTVHADGRDTVAEVRDGTFRARWPLPQGAAHAQAATGPSASTYTLTLRDGTVLGHQRPVSGSGS